MGFSVLVELLNLRRRTKETKAAAKSAAPASS
jgi:hypothetical protein